jgi:hypothetical protein
MSSISDPWLKVNNTTADGSTVAKTLAGDATFRVLQHGGRNRLETFCVTFRRNGSLPFPEPLFLTARVQQIF